MSSKRTITDLEKLDRKLWSASPHATSNLKSSDLLYFVRLRAEVKSLLYSVQRGQKLFPRQVIAHEGRAKYILSRIFGNRRETLTKQARRKTFCFSECKHLESR